MRTIRLLVTEKCTRNCEGCCNKDIKPEWGIKMEDVIDHCDDLLLITGGEPLLFPEQLCVLLESLHQEQEVILYTGIFPDEDPFMDQIIQMLDGITFTIHDERGVDEFIALQRYLNVMETGFAVKQSIRVFPPKKRVNIFCDVKITKPINFYGWDVKFIEWVKDCPLPKEETFLQLDPLWT